MRITDYEWEAGLSSLRFTAVIKKGDVGYYAFCPEIQGCYTSGETLQEARINIADAIRLHVDDRLATGEEF